MAHPHIPRELKYQTITVALITAIIPISLAKADTTTTADYIFLVNGDRQNCEQIGFSYQQIEAFETASFFVNICKKENNYYYLGEAKTGAIGAIFLPADALSEKTYRASNGNVSYLVEISTGEATLTIERNGEPVAIETSNKQCSNSHTILPVQITSQIDFLSNSGRRTISDNNYVKLNQLETIEIDDFYELQSLNEYNIEAILNALQCQ